MLDAGLEHVVAAETVLSDVDGANGRLIVRGMPVEELAATFSFEQAIHLLWEGFFAGLPAPDVLQDTIGAARADAFVRLTSVASMRAALEPVGSLRTAYALTPDGDDLAAAIAFIATGAVETAARIRAGRGLAPIAPDPELSYAADFLRMARGEAASKAEARALDAYLVTIADHGLNASTFAARVVASTRAGLGSAVIAGRSALKGPLHGGAPGPVLDMIDAIGKIEHAEAWIEAALNRRERLMGFGHRIYRVRDPRADALKTAIGKLPQQLGRLAFAEEIERIALASLKRAQPERRLETNVEFYTALLLEALALPREAFTCIFACGRSAGWIAHAQEQLATKRLIRPQSNYVGPTPKAAA